ncbi:MAG: UbiA family prenyltransferase [Elusimicrobia bacterium]|nr:UbiA family prenyltransferase [Elusimicrobiota bacterium]
MAWANFAFKYRLHLIALYFLAFLNSVSVMHGAIKPGFAAAGLCFSCLAAAVYLFNMIWDDVEDRINSPGECLEERQKPAVRVGSLGLFLIPFIYLWAKAPLRVWGSYLGIGLLGILYSRPWDGTDFRLKNSAWTKTATMTACVFWTVVVVPLMLKHPLNLELLWRCWLRAYPSALVIAATGLLWDIRDARGDAAAGVNTLPALWGAPATVALICAMMSFNLLWPAMAAGTPTKANSLITLIFAAGSIEFKQGLYFHALILAQTAAVLACLA